MYRECLLTHVAALDASASQLDADDRALMAAVEDGYLEAIVFWEVVAPRAPAIMLLIPDRVRDKVREYIERYVFVSTRIAEVTPSTQIGPVFLPSSLPTSAVSSGREAFVVEAEQIVQAAARGAGAH